MLRFVHQTTAIDIWSVGVMLLICLSGCYPYFEAQDDADALVEFLSVFGTKKMKACAAHYGKYSKIPQKKDDY
jgi:cell division control protein 7